MSLFFQALIALGVVAMVLLMVLGLRVVELGQPTGDEPSGRGEVVPPVNSVDGTLMGEVGFVPYEVPFLFPKNLNELLANHRAACGLDGTAEVESQRLEGIIRRGRERYEVVALKKRPHFYRMTTTSRRERRSYVFDGTTAWVETDRFSRVLLPEETKNLARDALIFSPLLTPDAHGAELEWQGREVEGGGSYHVVLARYPDGGEERYYLDPVLHLIRYRKREAWMNNGWMTQKTGYSGYRRVGEHVIPTIFEDEIGNAGITVVEFSNIEFNVGVVSNLFQPPKDLR